MTRLEYVKAVGYHHKSVRKTKKIAENAHILEDANKYFCSQSQARSRVKENERKQVPSGGSTNILSLSKKVHECITHIF